MDNTVSINTQITVDSYQVVDDLGIVDETVQVDIVDALFTSTQPDWNIDDPDSPYYIKNKPTKTSDFENDGSDGTSRYVELDELTDLNKVDDVQVKTTNQYISVLDNKIAKIDLSGYVSKEFKTGSSSEYKVLSDNNFTDADKAKIGYLISNGDGSQALTNDGTYKKLYNILRVNGVSPSNQEITIGTNDINYSEGTLSDYLAKLVPFNSNSDKSITLDNNKYLFGKNTSGIVNNLIGIDGSNKVKLGSSSLDLTIFTANRPLINAESVAYLSDITSYISTHNSSETAHNDIREELNSIEEYAAIQLTNAEMVQAISTGNLEDGKIVIPTDTDNYIAGKVYKFIAGSPNSFRLLSNWQIENIYGYTAPSTSTVGVIGQLYYDIINLKIYRCGGISDNTYIWNDITPAGTSESSLIQSIINNTTIISDENGGFTAGNNYVLLDSNGMIPVERIPQAVLSGLTYGGSFDGNGIITASSQAQAIDGQNISTVNKLYYKNYYFLATSNYTLDGVQYISGNFALSSGTEWVKIANSGQVISVNGKDGIVTLTYTDVNAIGSDKLVTSWSATTLDTNVPSEKLVKDSLDSKQDTLSTTQQNAVNSGITSSLVTQIGTNQTNISNISALIPSQATDQNQLADKDFVNSSINAFAAFYITRNAAGDPFRTKAELNGTSTYYSGGSVRVPTTNDYCIILADETKATSVSGYSAFTSTDQYVGYHVIYNYTDTLVTSANKDSIGITPGTTVCYYTIPTTRYSYQGSQWEYQYTLNDTSLTAAQLAAINSGITSSLVAQISTNASNISSLSSSKANDNAVVHLTGAETISGIKTFSANTIFTGNLTDGTNSINIAGIVAKANKTTGADYTLTAANWNNNTYTLSVTGKTASNNALVSNSNTGTNQEVLANAEAISDANIYKIIDNGTTLTFVCETTPTTNIKVRVEVYE